MGLLVGLPLRIFSLLAGLILLALRLAVPIAIAAAAVLLFRASRRWNPPPRQENGPEEPHFNGPVYTVDYWEEPSEDGKKEE